MRGLLVIVSQMPDKELWRLVPLIREKLDAFECQGISGCALALFYLVHLHALEREIARRGRLN